MARWWTAWVASIVGLVPASGLLWMVGGMAMCGEETYDTPPGTFGYSACEALVAPIVPWAAIAAAPVVVAVVGGLVALRRRDPRLLAFSLAAPLALIVGCVFFALALF